MSGIATCTPLSVKSNLSFLERSALNDDSSYSELAKFGLSMAIKAPTGSLL